MNGLDAPSNHHGRGFAMEITVRTQRLPPLFQERNPTHVVALKYQGCRKSRFLEIHLVRYTRRRLNRRYDVTPFCQPTTIDRRSWEFAVAHECSHCFEGRVPCRACDGAGSYAVTGMDAPERIVEDCGACSGTGECPCSICAGTGEIGVDVNVTD
jgi:hypothetical protein